MRVHVRTTALLAAAAVGIGACGEDEKTATVAAPAATATTPAAVTETTASTPEPTTVPTTTATEPAKAAKYKIAKDLKTKPEIPKPTGDPPAELVVQDIVKGKGKEAKSGDTVTVEYVGVSFSTGEQFDASWDRPGQPFSFALGTGGVIPGWDQGVPGMKKGGRRLLVIPPDLAYGPSGQGAIGPNETLVFVIDMKKIG